MVRKREFSWETKSVKPHTKDAKMCAKNACLIFNKIGVKYYFSPEFTPFSERIKILPHDVVRVRPDNFSHPVSEPEVKMH